MSKILIVAVVSALLAAIMTQQRTSPHFEVEMKPDGVLKRQLGSTFELEMHVLFPEVGAGWETFHGIRPGVFCDYDPNVVQPTGEIWSCLEDGEFLDWGLYYAMCNHPDEMDKAIFYALGDPNDYPQAGGCVVVTEWAAVGLGTTTIQTRCGDCAFGKTVVRVNGQDCTVSWDACTVRVVKIGEERGRQRGGRLTALTSTPPKRSLRWTGSSAGVAAATVGWESARRARRHDCGVVAQISQRPMEPGEANRPATPSPLSILSREW